MKTWRAAATTVAFATIPFSASAQSLVVQAFGALSTHNEVAESNRQDGFGAGAGATFSFARFAIEGSVQFTAVSPATNDALESFDMTEANVRARYAVTPLVGAELGYMRRSISPEFAAQDVGLFSIGARLENSLASVADMFVRGEFAPIADFSGGGSGGLTFGVGFGVAVGPAGGRWRVRAEYAFQRIGRSVSGTDVPIQVESARLGLTLRVI